MTELPGSDTGQPLFPLVRHLSGWLTHLLLRTFLTPNMITSLSLVLGLSAAAMFATGRYAEGIWGAIFFAGNYILDNCDGEIARRKDMQSTFGHYFDSFVDWVVHATLFAGLGYGYAEKTATEVWLWLGLISALGTTINYCFGVWQETVYKPGKDNDQPDELDIPNNIKDWILFIFRELFRADFFIIVLVLALIDQTWLLLPTAAVGAHAYWIMAIAARDKNYRV